MISTKHTKEERRQTGIYCILNLLDSKMYIGSASRNFGYRWRVHNVELKANRHHCSRLINAIRKYGIENFKFIILETCAPEQCIEREQWHFNILQPEYNSSPVAGSSLGRKLTSEAKQKMREAKLRSIYTVQLPSNEFIEVGNLYQFCIKNNLQMSSLAKTLTGKSSNGLKYTCHKGYKLISKTPLDRDGNPIKEKVICRDPAIDLLPKRGSEQWSKEDSQKKCKYEYVIETPIREVVRTNSVNQFCIKNNLRSTHLLYTLKHPEGRASYHKGYKILSKTPLTHQKQSI